VSVSPQHLLRAITESGLLQASEQGALIAEARRARKDPLEVASARLRLPREVFYRALAQQRGLPFCETCELVPDRERLALLPVRLLIRRGILPVQAPDGAPLLAISDPEQEAAIEAVATILGAPPRLSLAEPSALQAVLRRATGQAAASESGWDAVAFLHDLLRQAWLHRASDLHLDPQQDGLTIRMRVDGRLQPHGPVLPHEDANQLMTRIKVLGGLDIAERREPQDGGFSYRLEEEDQDLDLRLATIPTRREGERATLRILGVETQRLTIGNLGFSQQALARLRETLAQPHGLFLLTGPTGSGKTTTLYAALRELARPDLSVLTVEDPVEFMVEGVTQIQVDRAGKVTFARALRSLLRHDPDVLMVGEIRDRETTDVAVQAALTGHLVLSSLHTNRAAAAPVRLIDLGSEPFLLASVLRGALAQRLVRRLCERCRRPREAEPGELARMGHAEAARVWEPEGCPSCLGSGYQGRLAVTEALWVDSEIARAIEGRASEDRLLELARAKGGGSLLEDALAKVLSGETSPAEAWRARA